MMTDQTQVQTPLDATRAILASAEQRSKEAGWRVSQLDSETAMLAREHIQTDISAMKQAKLAEQRRTMVEYARSCGEYVRTIEKSIQARERQMSDHRHAVSKAEDNLSSAGRTCEKAQLELERAQQTLMNCKNEYDNTSRVLAEKQAIYNTALEQPIILPNPPVAPEIA